MTMKTSSILNAGIKPVVLVLLLSLTAGIAYGQNPNSEKKRKDIEKRAGFVVTADRKDIVVDKDMFDAYVRIMRYQTAWQDIYNKMNNNPTAMDDYLTIAINNVETGDMKKLANYLKAIKQPSADVLSVNRHIVCGRGGEAGDCELGYEVNWAKEGAQYGLKFNTPNTGNVDEYITYDITVEYKGESVTHGGVILHYRNKNAGFLIYDGIIPHIDDLVLDRMPLLVEPRPNNGNQSKVKKLPAAKVWGWGAATTDDDGQPPIGWLPGDYEELPGYDWDGGGIMLMATTDVCECSPDGTTCPDDGTPYCTIDKCKNSICTHTKIDPVTAYSPDPEPLDTDNLLPDTETARICLKNAVEAAGGTFETKSGYRSQVYQNHLRDLWDKWKIKDLENWVEAECNTIKNDMKTEWQRHGLSAEPAKVSNHTSGRSFDGRATGLPSGTSVTTLAEGCQLTWLKENNNIYHYTR